MSAALETTPDPYAGGEELEARRSLHVLAASERLAAASGMEEVVQILRDTAREAVGAQGIAVILKDGDRCSYVAEDAMAPLWTGQSFPADTCVSGWAMRHAQTVCIRDVERDPRVPQAAYAPTFVRSLIMAPIGRPEPVAALGAYWAEPVDHDRATVARLESLARLATIAMENARLAQARDRAAALGAAQSRILELAVREAPLKSALAAIVREVEGLSTGLLGSILLLDGAGARLRLGAAPSLSPAYNEAIDGIAIGPSVGSCGTAVFRGEPVIVSDIKVDPLWADFRDLALQHGLRACWSIPVRSSEGPLLGTFAMYHREPRSPQPADLKLVDFVVRSVALLIERDRSNTRLRESEARTGFALKAGRLGAWELEVGNLELVASDTCRANFGRDAAHPFTYDDLRSSVHPDDRPVMTAAVERSLLTGEDYDIEYRVITPAGEVRWVQIRGRTAHNDAGAPVRMAGVSLDITERREAEAALRESEERLRLAVDNADVGFWDVDVVNDTLTWPARTKAMFGISADVPVTMQDFYDGLHPEDLEATSAAYAAASDPQRRGLYDVEYRTIGREDGVVRWIAAKGRGVFEAATGRCLRVTGTAVDITARKQAEEALRELNATLEARIEKAVAEREEAQEALRQSQKMEAMGQLTGGVAHDFNNLLTPIVGALDLLQRRGIGGEREQRLISGAAQSAERARTLVQRLLAFARRQPLQAVAIDVSRLVSGMGELVASTTGPQIKVIVDAPQTLPPAVADPNQLEMALLNLAVNARDAMPDGGTLRISAHAEAVRPGHRSKLRTGRYVRLCVSDTGFGMDEATLARAVEPFFSTKGIGKGTGLGLSMVHGLASQLDGALLVQSRVGLGTDVELWLPQSSVAPAPDTSSAQVQPPSLARGTALLVDDEELVRASTADMLTELGYSVLEAASGEEALRLVESGRAFDLLVTDHLMPGVSGTDLAFAVRLNRPKTPILLVSGYAERESLHPGLPRLHKPFRKDELAASLSELGVNYLDAGVGAPTRSL